MKGMCYLSLPSGTFLAIDGLEVVNTDKLEIDPQAVGR